MQQVQRFLCAVSDLADGRSRGFDPLDEGRDTMFLVRQGPSIYGYRNACPHYDFAPMAWRRHEFLNGERTNIMCAAHGALFEIESGLCISGPCVEQELTPVRLEIRDDAVWLCDIYKPGRRKRHDGR